MASERAWLVIAALALACAGEPAAASSAPVRPATARVRSCDYDVRVTSSAPLLLDVDVACDGVGVRGLRAARSEVTSHVSRVTSPEGTVVRRGDVFRLARGKRRVSFRYTVDLEALARESEDFDLAQRVGASVIAPASGFLLHPLPLGTDTDVRVRVSAPGSEFSSGLGREGDYFRLQAHEILSATYAAFGRFARRSIGIDDGRAEIELVVLDGPLRLNQDVLARSVETSARAVSRFYGGFPARRAWIGVIPVRGRSDIVFGKLRPESGPGIALLLGSETSETQLADDWVLVHELFHIGVPSFADEGKWFDEGLATYFEPIVRARAGLLDEARVFREFVESMPRGLPALESGGLERAEDRDGIYWGGGLFCLLADLEVRRASAGRLGLEDGLRRVLAAGGNASEVWDLGDVFRVADSALTAPVLAPFRARYAAGRAPPERPDLDAVFRDLGVHVTPDRVELRDDAPLAWLRRALLSGQP